VKALIIVVSISILSACTWVKPAVGSEHVALVKPAHIETCKLVGRAAASVPHKLTFVPRSTKKVADELLTLGRAEAVSMGGDTLVSVSAPVDGHQSFDVYSCNVAK